VAGAGAAFAAPTIGVELEVARAALEEVVVDETAEAGLVLVAISEPSMPACTCGETNVCAADNIRRASRASLTAAASEAAVRERFRRFEAAVELSDPV
jgi:hypothetical protein